MSRLQAPKLLRGQIRIAQNSDVWELLGEESIYACLISAFGKRVILSIRTLYNVPINIGRYGHSSHGLCNRRVRVFLLFFTVLFLRLLLCEFRLLSLYVIYVPAPEI